VKPDDVYFYVDTELEKKISMSSSFWKLVDNIKSSARSTTGDFNGPNVMFTGSRYTSSPVGLLASMRLLQTKDLLLRKRVEKDNVALTFFMLQQKFNGSLGIKSEDSKSYAVLLLKGILASCVKPHNAGFPGGWVHKNREINKVKADAGLIQLMGWTEKIVSPYKLQEVLFNPVDNSHAIVNGKSTIIGRSMKNLTKEGRSMSFQEFRTAVYLTVPRLLFESVDNLEKQSKIEPLDHSDPRVIDNFARNETISIVENLNQSFAFKVNLKNPKSKTNLAHYENARGRLLASTANKKIVDGNGNTYTSFDTLPTNVKTFLRRKYRYPEKRAPESSAEKVQSEENMEIVLDTSPTEAVVKKRKLRKGDATRERASHKKTIK